MARQNFYFFFGKVSGEGEGHLKPIAIISIWKKKLTDDQRYNKPSILSSLPDTLMYVDGDFYSCDKMRNTLCTN